ncbi:MAG: hypothetical protein H6673_00685 [Anaerolineales bacterium]|nr:hypothetical protein [Anaerolineales bacterium]
MIVGGVLVLLGGTAGIGGSLLEEHDRNCTVCHVAAERTYYNRAQLAMDAQDETIPDLSSYHYVVALNTPQMEAFRCVDCHRGRQTIPDRVLTLGLGIYDTAVYATGGGSSTAIESATLKHSQGMVEKACIHCHSDTLETLGFNNHYHNYLPAAEAAYRQTGNLTVEEGLPFAEERRLLLEGLQTAQTDTSCTDCHLAHVTVIGGERVQFIQEAVRNTGCTRCHMDVDLRIDLTSENDAE